MVIECISSDSGIYKRSFDWKKLNWKELIEETRNGMGGRKELVKNWKDPSKERELGKNLWNIMCINLEMQWEGTEEKTKKESMEKTRKGLGRNW